MTTELTHSLHLMSNTGAPSLSQKLSAVKVAQIFYISTVNSEKKKMVSANEQNVCVCWSLEAACSVLILSHFTFMRICFSAEGVIMQHSCWKKRWHRATRTRSNSSSVAHFLSKCQAVGSWWIIKMWRSFPVHCFPNLPCLSSSGAQSCMLSKKHEVQGQIRAVGESAAIK